MAERQVAAVRRDAWFLRLYLWMWEGDVEKVDFCRLFWGYVFAIPNLLVRLLALPFWLGYKAIRSLGRPVGRFVGFVWESIPQVPAKPVAPGAFMLPAPVPAPSPKLKAREEARERRREMYDRLFKRTAEVVDRGVVLVQTSWPYLRWVLYGLAVALSLGIGFLAGWGLYILSGYVDEALAGVWSGLSWFGAFLWQWSWVVPVAIAGIGLFLLILFVVVRSGRAITASPVVQRAGDRTADRTLGFFEAISGGAKAVKYRTCPIIEVVEEEPK